MDLNSEYSDIKTLYRKIFSECLEDAKNTDNLENVWQSEIKEQLEQINSSRSKLKCVGCGMCCRFAVSEFSPAELKIKAKNGDNYSSQFIQTFVPYETVDEARAVYPEYVNFLENHAEEKYYFYHCPKVTDDNKCSDYEHRPQICRDFPDVTSLFLPKTCNFKSWNLKSLPVWLKLNAQIEILDFYKSQMKD